jgi:hypothetical protein
MVVPYYTRALPIETDRRLLHGNKRIREEQCNDVDCLLKLAGWGEVFFVKIDICSSRYLIDY